MRSARLSRLLRSADHLKQHLLQLRKRYPIIAVVLEHLFEHLAQICTLHSLQQLVELFVIDAVAGAVVEVGHWREQCHVE